MIVELRFRSVSSLGMVPFKMKPKVKRSSSVVHHVECVYWTEPKATCRQWKNQPNAFNMNTDLEEILSACLYLHASFYPGVVNFCRYVFSLINAFTTVGKVDKRYDNLIQKYLAYKYGPYTGETQIYRKKPPQRILR
jgi:hypothetical protein